MTRSLGVERESSFLRDNVPKVSVIIPCYNLGQYLNEAVDSVLSQTFRDFEIIIVNDGSTDEYTNDLIGHYDRPKTKVLCTDNQGLSSARNNGINIAEGEYVCCLDADDKYHPDFLKKTVDIMCRDGNKKVGFVTTWVQTFGERHFLWKPDHHNPIRLAIENTVHVASLYRRECWERVGGYAANLAGGYEDWNFWISIVAIGYTWDCVEDTLFYYRKRKRSMVSSSDIMRGQLFSTIVENNEGFYRQHFKEILLEATNNWVKADKGLNDIATAIDKVFPAGTFRRRSLMYLAKRLLPLLR